MTQTLLIVVDAATVMRILTLAFLSFVISILITPLYTTLAYAGQWWKKPRQTTLTGEVAKVFTSLHSRKHHRLIPTMAGLVFVVSVAFVTFIGNLSRSETWLPLAAFLGAGLIGILDDIINLKSNGLGVAGLPAKIKFLLITAVALVGGLFFHYKLAVSSFNLPLIGNINIGWLIVPLFVLVVVSTANAVNITDGLDGLAGGLCSVAFAIYAIIAFLENRFGVAGFCLTIVGSLLAYTWFNVYPARFFMGDIGSFALGTALGVVAMLTDTVALLPIIGAVFVAEAGSVLLQLISKKLRSGKKIFKASPIHHHFEASGWPETKITMRFWILGQVAGVLGLILFMIGRAF